MLANTYTIVNIVLSVVLSCISIITLLITSCLFYHFCGCERGPNLSSTHSLSVTASSKSKLSVTKLSKNSLSKVSSVNSLTSSSSNIHRNKSRDSKKPKIHGFFKYAALVGCILFCIVCISVNIDRILLIFDPNSQLSFLAYPIWIPYFLGRMLIVLIFLGRLFFTFRGSSLEYSKCTMNTLYFLWGLMPTFAITSTMIIGIDTELLMIGVIFGTLFILCDIVLSIILLFLYLKKLFDLTSVEHSNNDKLINLMTRYCILYCTCFITTFIVFMLLALSPLNPGGSYRYQQFIWCIVSADSMFNVLCLWLNFAFAKKWYFKICGFCHNKCDLCCTKNKNMDDNGKILNANNEQQKIEIQTLKDQSSFDDEDEDEIDDESIDEQSGIITTKN